MTSGGARYRVDPDVGGAEDTQRALRVEVEESVTTDSGYFARAPYAHNGPAFTLPQLGSGKWWLRRGSKDAVDENVSLL